MKKKINNLSQLISILEGVPVTDSGLKELCKLFKNYSNIRRMEDIEGSFYFIYKATVRKRSYAVKVIVKLKKNNLQVFPEKSNKTISKYFLYPVWHTDNNAIIVQPWVKIEVTGKNYKKISRQKEEMAWELVDFWRDGHKNNIGLHKGKLVIIDYQHGCLR